MAWFTKGPRPPSRIRSTCQKERASFLKCQGCGWGWLPFPVNFALFHLFLCQKERLQNRLNIASQPITFCSPLLMGELVELVHSSFQLLLKWNETRVFQAKLLLDTPRVGPTGNTIYTVYTYIYSIYIHNIHPGFWSQTCPPYPHAFPSQRRAM